jgi:hypothetical protein
MAVLRPGQLEPNEFELAILERLAQKLPSLGPLISKLHVLSREFTGVGCYTKFQCDQGAPDLSDQLVGLDAHISMPNVPLGLLAVLSFENGMPKQLEICTYDPDRWGGVFEGFAIEAA